MTDLERQLTAALERSSAQYEREQRRHSEQVEALRQQVEALQRQIERLNEQRATDTLGRVLRDIRRRETARPSYLMRRPGPDRDHGPSR